MRNHGVPMKKIKWCLKNRNGIELIESNENLAEGYILKAEEALEESRIAKSKDWQISAAYYAIYFSLYSILMKIGVKCEIHSCTIAFAKRFLKDYFDEDDFELMDDAFQARNDSQYYVDRSVPDGTFNLVTKNAAEMLIKCRNIKLDEKAINKIRQELKEIKG